MGKNIAAAVLVPIPIAHQSPLKISTTSWLIGSTDTKILSTISLKWKTIFLKVSIKIGIKSTIVVSLEVYQKNNKVLFHKYLKTETLNLLVGKMLRSSSQNYKRIKPSFLYKLRTFWNSSKLL